MSVSTLHPDYQLSLPTVTLVRDAVAGDPAIKKRRELYLPADFAKDPQTNEYTDHYLGYLSRAYFLGVTGRTKESLVGMVFRKPPTYELPPALEELLEDIDGAGQSLEQIGKNLVGELLEAGKHILLVDYPTAPDNADRETESRMGLRPTIAPYQLESLINWRFEGVNGRQKLTLAVLAEEVETDDNEFSHDTDTVFRVLRLTEDGYTQQVYDDAGRPKDEPYTPRMAGGEAFDHIPLHIAGAKTNLPGIDMPPLYDIARTNIGHYQTTGNVMESGYVGTQPLIHVDVGQTDLSEWKEHNPGPVTLGNRNGLVTKGGKLEIVQAESTDYNMNVMERLESQMVMLGARLVQSGGQPETAEAVRVTAAAEASVLEVVVGNGSEAIEAALEDVARFMGIDPDTVSYSLSSNFWESTLDANQLQAVIQARQFGIIGAVDALGMIRQGSIKLNDERTDEEILEDAASGLLDNLPDEQ